MPLSEFLRLAIENLEASKKKSCSANRSVSGTENNLVGVDVVASEELDLSQNDELVPCLNDGLQDYFSEGLYGVKAKETSGSKRSSSSCDQANRYLDNNGQDAFKFPSCKARSRLPQQGQTSRFSGISTNNHRQNVMFGNGDPISGGNGIGVKRMEVKESDQTMVNSGQLSVKKHKEKSFCGKSPTQNNNVLDGVEPVFASSSVGSGNSGDRVSYEETHNLKRKFCYIECECHSDDIQIGSIGVQKPTAARGDTGPKKSRTAEVHNLSERRRRDRINEKMRALQELIPHCNKADKASMLDDAIQYLKNLQHQVQSMSMGAGLCMPPMMFAPPGSQHMYPTHYSPMGMSYPFFPVPSIQGMRIANFHTRPPSIPFTEAHLRIPTTSLNLNSEDPIKRTNSQSTRNAKNQGSD